MNWNLDTVLDYYKKQGAPADQTALMSLLRQTQEEFGCVPYWVIQKTAENYQVKESFLLAIVKRIPTLRLEDTHTLEICCGPNCRSSLAFFVERTYGAKPKGFSLKLSGCMRMCGKGPNIKWDGKLYNGATEDLIHSLVEK